jgi:colanic acid/amylovoran biosynthesis glycosyltransferase
MKIAYFTNAYPKVSHTFIRREIQAMEKHGFEIVRASLRSSNDLIDPDDIAEAKRTHYLLDGGWTTLIGGFALTFLHQPLTSLRVLWLSLRLGLRSDRSLATYVAYVLEAAKFGSICRSEAVTHIHAHFGTNSATVAMLAGMLTGLPYSYTAHRHDELDQFSALELEQKLKRAKFVVTISWYLRSQILWRLPFADWHKINVIHCGLAQDYIGAEIPPYPKSPQLLCLGRVSEEKAQHILVEAAARVRDKGLKFKLVLAGDGPTRKLAESEIAKYRLQDVVSITGWIDGASVKREIEAATVFVLPSFIEGLPVAIMEAMALGRPVLSTYIAGIPELVQNGKSGWLVPPGDVDALAEALELAVNVDRKELVAMGKEAQARVRLRHNLETEVPKLVRLIKV